MAAIVCAGSRRRPLQEQFPAVKGARWTNGAIGNGSYKGVPLRHILLNVMGLEEANLVGKDLHVIFMGYDADF